MPEYSGTLQSFELAVALWLAPLLPLVAAIYAGIGGYVAGADDSGLPKAFRPRSVATLAALAALGLVGFHLVVVLGLPADQRQLVSHAWTVQRVGSLDTSFTFSADPTTSCLAFALSLAALVGLALAGRESPERERPLAGGICLVLSGGLFLTLGDDLLLVVSGSVLSGLGTLALASGESAGRAARGFVLSRLGDAALVGAAAALLWGLSGSWAGDGEYVPDFRPRLVSVQIGAAPAPPAEKGKPVKDAFGSISMAALPGSTLVIGGAELCLSDPDGKRGGVGTSARPCREVARSPFSRLPLGVALHDIEVRTGPGSNDFVVEKTRISSGVETLIANAGATSVVREMRDQLLIRDGSGAYPLRAALTKKRIFDQPLLGLVGGLLAAFVVLRGLGAAWSLSQRAAAASGPSALAVLAGGAELSVAALVLVRLDFLFGFVPGTASALAALAALAALVAAAQASHGFELRGSLALVAVANAALCVTAAALGAHAAAVVGIVVTAAGMGAIALVVGGHGDLRELAGRAASRPEATRAVWLAGAALAGAPVPAAGVAWARDGALAAGATAGSSLGTAALVLAALATGVTAFAVWRVCFVVTTGKAKGELGDPRFESAALALAMAALVFGALAHASAVVGDALPSVLERWLTVPGASERGVPLERSVRAGVAGLAFVAAVVGFAMARARYGAARDKGWADSEAKRPLASALAAPRELFDVILLRPADAAGAWVGRFDAALEALVAGGEREVVEPPSEPPPHSITKRKKAKAEQEEEP